MARRRNKLSSLLEGFNAGYDTVGRVLQDREIREIGEAKPVESEGFTEDQGAQLRAAADSGQYDIGIKTKDDGTFESYTITPKSDPGNVGVMARQGVTDFMGTRRAGKMSPSEVSNARTMAMAGVLKKSNPLEGMRMEQQAQQFAQQGVLTDLQIKGAQRTAAREDKADARTAKLEEVDNDVAAWTEKRLANPDGTRRDLTVDDQLAIGQYRASRLVGAGMLAEANALAKDNMSFAANKIQLQTAERNEELGRVAAAVGAGDYSKLGAFYDKYVPDGAKVTGVIRDPESGKITIERETVDGRKVAPVTLKDQNELMAALKMFQDPMALYNFSQSEFNRLIQQKTSDRADATLQETVRHNQQQERTAAVQAGTSQALANAQISKINEEVKSKQDLAAAHGELSAAIESGNKDAENKARAKLMSYALGTRGSNMSDTERRANFFLASGAAKTPADAARMAHEKVQSSPKDDFIKLTTGAMPLQGSELSSAMETMHGKDWKNKVQGTTNNPQEFASVADVERAAKEGKVKKGDRVIVNGRTATWQ